MFGNNGIFFEHTLYLRSDILTVFSTTSGLHVQNVNLPVCCCLECGSYSSDDSPGPSEFVALVRDCTLCCGRPSSPSCMPNTQLSRHPLRFSLPSNWSPAGWRSRRSVTTNVSTSNRKRLSWRLAPTSSGARKTTGTFWTSSCSGTAPSSVDRSWCCSAGRCYRWWPLETPGNASLHGIRFCTRLHRCSANVQNIKTSQSFKVTRKSSYTLKTKSTSTQSILLKSTESTASIVYRPLRSILPTRLATESKSILSPVCTRPELVNVKARFDNSQTRLHFVRFLCDLIRKITTFTFTRWRKRGGTLAAVIDFSLNDEGKLQWVVNAAKSASNSAIRHISP